MKLYFDLGKERLLSVPRGGEINLIHLKAGGLAQIEVDFYNGKAATTPSFTPLIQFAVKTSEEGSLLAFADFDAFTGSGAFWGGELLTNTAEMVAWLDGASSKLAVAELTLRDGEEGIPIRSQTLQVRVANHVIRGDEGTPGTLPLPLAWLAANGIVYDPAITGLTGGGATKLDGISHVGLAAGRLQAVISSGYFSLYRLVAGDQVEVSPTTINVDSAPDAWSWTLDSMRVFAVEADGINSSLITTPDLRLHQAGDFETYAGFSVAALTTLRTFSFPNRSGTFAVGIPEHATLAAANAAIGAIGVVFYNLATSRHEVTTEVA